VAVGLSVPPVVLGQSVPSVVPGLSVPPVVIALSVPPVVPELLVPPVVLGQSVRPLAPGLSVPLVVPGLSVPPVVPGLLVPPVVLGQSVPPLVPGLSVPPVAPGLLVQPVGLGQSELPLVPGLSVPAWERVSLHMLMSFRHTRSLSRNNSTSHMCACWKTHHKFEIPLNQGSALRQPRELGLSSVPLVVERSARKLVEEGKAVYCNEFCRWGWEGCNHRARHHLRLAVRLCEIPILF
jgi:hypothetical protein